MNDVAGGVKLNDREVIRGSYTVTVMVAVVAWEVFVSLLRVITGEKTPVVAVTGAYTAICEPVTVTR